MSQSTLLIATLLPAAGDTGVQTHIRTCSNFAASQYARTVRIVTPYEVSKLIRGPLRRFAKLCGLCNEELEILLNRYFLSSMLSKRLASAIGSKCSRCVVYAQDPLSARAALKLKRNGFAIDVVLAIHFNISEASEMLWKGVAREGGKVWKNLTQLEQTVLPSVDRIIFVSQFMKRTVLDRVPNASKVPSWVIPNFVKDPNAAISRNRNGDLITIGTLEPRKNHSFLLRMLAEAHRFGRPYRLSIVGDGVSMAGLRRLSNKLGLEPYVTFMGMVPDAMQLIASHKVLVHSSLMESFGIVLVEALACGVPVFAAPVGGIPEVFDDGVEGFYWDLCDPSAAARQLIRLMEDERLYMQMSAAARRRYEGAFTPAAAGATLMSAVLGEPNFSERGKTLSWPRTYPCMSAS